MSAIATTEPSAHSAISIKERYIQAQVGTKELVFPARWVAKIFRIQRSSILDLPFYPLPLLGVAHYNSQIVPLASAHHLLQTEENTLRETVTVLQLSSEAGTTANIGIVVDKTLGSVSSAQLPPSIFTTPTLPSQDKNIPVLFQSDWFPSDLWHPQG